MGASTYKFKNLPKPGDIVKETMVAVHQYKGDEIPDISYWIKIKDGWIHMPIGDRELENILIDKNIPIGEYTLDEFYEKIN